MADELIHKKELVDAGLKNTRARNAILHLLEIENRPVAVPEIIENLGEEGIGADQATVYRILEKFLEKELVHRFEFQEGKFRYELAGEEHHHLICTNCGKIEDVSDCNLKELEIEIRAKKGFLVKKHSLEFFGICNSCQH